MKIILLFSLVLLTTGCEALTNKALQIWMAGNQNLQLADATVTSQARGLEVTVRAVAQDLELPWDMAFINDVEFLVTEKPGRLSRINLSSGVSTLIQGVPEVAFKGQGGLLGVALHPLFAENSMVYLSYSIALNEGTYTTRLLRARLLNEQLVEQQVLFTAEPALTTRKHFGGAMVFDNQGYLYLSVGDRGRRDNAQDLGSHLGKIHRLNADGSVPRNNPFIDQSKVLPEIYSWGHRNPQGLAIHPQTGDVWAAEHGPQGGDEINLIRAGANYGWPVITYGEEYGGGKIGEGTAKPGMEQPVHYYLPSIGTAGIGFYTGDQIPQWRDNLLVTGLVYNRAHVSRLAMEGGSVVEEELLFDHLNMRMRGVEDGPDGALYILSENGILFAVERTHTE
ncbi:MAG: glucose/arabinose dehydrogenase [Alcanivorax sp.]|jgi:glucose/arabinose dehydrogenase